MASGHRRRIALAIALVLLVTGSIAGVASASARKASTAKTNQTAAAKPAAVKHDATGNLFGCTAAVAPVYLLNSTTPLLNTGVANAPVNPCVSSPSVVQTVGLNLQTLGLNLGTVGPAGASTYEQGEPGSTSQPAVAALADIQAVNLNLGAAGTLTVAGPIEAAVGYSCVNNQVQSYASSNLKVISVNGQTTTLPAAGQQQTLNLNPLLSITVNEQIKTGSSLTENLLDIKLLNATTGSVAQIIVGHAEVTENGANPCANTAPNGSSSSTTYIQSPLCQAGTLLDTKTFKCVIVTAGGQVITVSLPGDSPRGGTVIPLSEARSKYHSACLSGSGPNWVLVISKKGSHARGTEGSDRVLGTASNVWINALEGNDCVDLQGGGREHINEANGNDRDYSLKGSTRWVIGNGKDYINGENSGGWMTIGNGYDRIYGGNGTTRMDLGRGVKHVKTGKGATRLYYVGATGTQISCGNKKDVLFLRSGVRHYAETHGCEAARTHRI